MGEQRQGGSTTAAKRQLSLQSVRVDEALEWSQLLLEDRKWHGELVVRVPDPTSGLAAPATQHVEFWSPGPNGFHDDKGGFWQFFFSRVDHADAKVFAGCWPFFFERTRDNFVNP